MPRRLPVLPTRPADEDAAQPRPTWQWVLGAGGLSVIAWLPLAVAAMALGRLLAGRWVQLGSAADLARFEQSATPTERGLVALALVAPSLLAFGVACLLAGAVVGRFAGRSAPRSAASGVALAALLVGTLAFSIGSPASLATALTTVCGLTLGGAFLGWIGARIGARRRPRV